MPDLPKHRIDGSDCEEDTVAKDQASHGYYYDDAYGYEDYHANEDDMEGMERRLNDRQRRRDLTHLAGSTSKLHFGKQFDHVFMTSRSSISDIIDSAI